MAELRDNGFGLGTLMCRAVRAVVAGLVVLIALVASALGQATAQSSLQSQPGTDHSTSHPARKIFRAARLTYLMGNVLIEQANSTTEDVAVINMPVVEGSQVSTGEDGQAEVEFEDGSLVRLTPNSAITLPKLSVDGNGNYQTRVAVVAGLAYLELRAGTKYQYTVDAGVAVVSATENTTLRVSFDEPPAAIAVLDGAVHISTVTGATSIDATAGQTAAADPTSLDAPYLVKEGIAAESWDQWNEERDQIAASEAGTQTAARDQYAGDQGYGWSDLDASGSWYDVPGQGEVWQPSEADDAGPAAGSDQDTSDQGPGQGFDPYGYGSWVWTPAGYSWASAYSWGWLPYRCGQWFYFDSFGWGWQPGFACGVFGFGGYGFGGYGFGVNVGRAPGFWRHPKRPIPGPGPVHPIVHGRVGPPPIALARNYGDGRVVRVKTMGGRNIDPLPPVVTATALRGGAVFGSALKRDFPVSVATHQPATGIAPTHTVPPSILDGRNASQPGLPPVSGTIYGTRPAPGAAPGSGSGYTPRPAPVGRSNMMPAWPNYGYQAPRPVPAPAPRSQPAPAPRQSSPPPASHPAPAPASSPHK